MKKDLNLSLVIAYTSATFLYSTQVVAQNGPPHPKIVVSINSSYCDEVIRMKPSPTIKQIQLNITDSLPKQSDETQSQTKLQELFSHCERSVEK